MRLARAVDVRPLELVLARAANVGTGIVTLTTWDEKNWSKHFL